MRPHRAARRRGIATNPDAIRFTSYEELRLGAHERISIKRTSDEEGKR